MANLDEFRCMDAAGLLGVYALGATSDHETAHIERHLVQCSACLAEAAALTETTLYLSPVVRPSSGAEFVDWSRWDGLAHRPDRNGGANGYGPYPLLG
jgi:hypothetical protein